MPVIFIYILKVSLSLGVVFLFYHLVLRRLTFYNWNRWYLMGYSVLCFFLPFIDISIALEQSAIKDNAVITWVPVLGQNFINEPEESVTLGAWDYAGLVLITGILIMLIRFCIQLWSIRRMRRNAVLLSEDGMRLYQVDAAIIPFSFGDSIFINKDQHNIHELEEIIRHEFVHVKQKHSVDIIWGELLCLFNWYNPFAWLLKKAIRQNLEFIADRHVLEQGMDRKQYQYLLLKVIGNNHFSIANQFNFSSLKKRIAMMNKLRTARFHLVKFLFILPLVSVLLLAFRNQWNERSFTPVENKVSIAGLVVDNSTGKPLAGVKIYCPEKDISVSTDGNGYYIIHLPYENRPLQFSLQLSKDGFHGLKQQENWGNFYEPAIRNKYAYSYEFFALSDKKKENYGSSSLAGNAASLDALDYKNVMKVYNRLSLENGNMVSTDTLPEKNSGGAEKPISQVNNTLKDFLGKNPAVKNLGWVYGQDNTVSMIMVLKKDGTTEEYHTDNVAEMKAGAKKYGMFPEPPGAMPAPPPPGQHREVWVQGYPLPAQPPAPPAAAEVVTVQGYPLPPAPPQEAIVVQGYPKPASAPKEAITVQGYPLPASAPKEVVVTGYPSTPKPVKLPEHVKSINVRNGGKAIVELKNGKREEYDLTNPEDKKKFEAKYPVPPPPPPPPANGVRVEGYPVNVTAGTKVVEGKPLPDNLIYVIDGIITTKYEMEKINPDKIASVDILKGNSAVALYGESAREGVVQIKLKYDAQPLYVIDGEISTREALDKLNKEQIESIDVLKGEKATAAYGDKGKNGVLLIRTKK